MSHQTQTKSADKGSANAVASRIQSIGRGIKVLADDSIRLALYEGRGAFEGANQQVNWKLAAVELTEIQMELQVISNRLANISNALFETVEVPA